MKLLLSILVFAVLFNLSSSRAQAATLAVNNDCTLAEAIGAVNGAADGSGCVKTGAAYGTDDKINIPTGTITLSADLPALTKAIEITGAGANSTTINTAGNESFRYSSANNNEQDTLDFKISKLKITNAEQYAIFISGARKVEFEGLEITESGEGIRISNSSDVLIEDCYIHNNTTEAVLDDTTAGLAIELSTKASNGEAQAIVRDTRINNNTGARSGALLMSNEWIYGTNDQPLKPYFQLQRVQLLNNQATDQSGLLVIQSGGPLAQNSMELSVDATTVANNTVDVVVPEDAVNASVPILAGFLMTGKLTSDHHFTNVTVANNAAINTSPDDTRRTLAGFYASLAVAGSNMERF
ncbi:right-handed parallel beta-helix repeat-containing protein [Candidatus Saccharibacteria bacterium]|nr:MAG: right-handed parallel beta-helix repeat-containing protein [Candidatus Saccharibacteria bacterium]